MRTPPEFQRKRKRTSKVLWFNSLMFVVAMLAMPQVGALIPLEWMPFFLAVQAIGNLALRFVTKEPIV